MRRKLPEKGPARTARRLAGALAAVAAAGLAGCAGLGYYAHLAGGHLGRLARAEPVTALASDPATPPALRTRLALVEALRRFAAADLATCT